MLLERHGYLGGAATASNVNILFGLNAVGSDAPIVAGIAEELIHRMAALRGATPYPETIRRLYVVPEAFKYAAENLVQEAEVQLRYHSLVCGALVNGDRVQAALVETKAGRKAIRAQVFVDASGDGDLSCHVGCPTQSGRDYDGLTNAPSSLFLLGGVEPLSSEESQLVMERLAEATDAGRLQVRSLPHFAAYAPNMPGLMLIHTSRYRGRPLDATYMTEAEIHLRSQIWDLVEFLRREFPQFQNAYVLHSSPHMAIRESRRVVGEYVLTADDVVSGHKFDDGIARAGWVIDVHCPMGYTSSRSQLCNERCEMSQPCEFRDAGLHQTIPSHRLSDVSNAWPPQGSWYDIPYRSLVPLNSENLLVAGRCISGTHEAQASFRVMGTCMAMGQAAGTAAAICARAGVRCSDLDVVALRHQLVLDGALV